MRPGVALLALAAPLWSLDPTLSVSQYARRHWQVEDGLPQNYVTWISQTADGYLLVGTSGGAARFDGLRFRPLVLDEATGRSREWIAVVQPGADGKTIWVATRDDGFYELGKRRWPEQFASLIVARDGHPLALGSGLHRVAADGIERLHDGVHEADPSWNGLLEMPDGALLAAAANGLLLFRGPAGAPRTLLPPDTAAGRPLALAPSRRGGYWLGTSNGLYHSRHDPRGGPPALTAVAGVRGPVVSIVHDRDGVVWAGSWGFGVYRFAGGRVEGFAMRDGLPDNFIHAVFEDREGSLWIGSRAGLSRWKSTPVAPFGPGEGLAGQFISAVTGDARGNVWLGTWRSGLYRVRGGLPERIPLPLPDLGVLVRSAGAASDGSLWFSDWSALYRRGEGGWRRYGARELGYNPQIRAILFDRRGRLWVGAESGLFRHATTHPLASAEGLLPGRPVWALLEDSRGRVWAGCVDGLWRIDGDGRPVAVPGLPHPTVTSLAEDIAGRIWATTRANGLALIEGGGVRTLDQRQGLPALPLFAVVDDGKGALWMSSPAGVFELSVAPLGELLAGRRSHVPVLAWDQEDGMRSIECQNVGYPSAWRDPNGDIWFPTVRGAIRIRPGSRRALPPPSVLIEEARAERRSHIVRYTAARLAAPARIEFRYRLADGPAEWTYVGRERTLRFDSLAAGAHTLEIAAREPGGEWGPPAAVGLSQPPRFHETWWFRVLAAASAAAVLLLVYRWRIYILRGRYSAVLAERNRIAREWHDTLLAGFSAISWQLDVALKRLKEGPETAAGTVQTARTMVQHYRAEARRVIWDLRHEAPEPESLATAIASAVEDMTGGRGIASDVSVEGPARPVPGGVAQNLLRICQEAAANAIRHAEPSRIEVKLKYAGDAVSVIVRDDGRGFDPASVPPGHFGLQIMRERARRFGGELEVSSAAGKGTSVSAAIPLNGGPR